MAHLYIQVLLAFCKNSWIIIVKNDPDVGEGSFVDANMIFCT